MDEKSCFQFTGGDLALEWTYPSRTIFFRWGREQSRSLVPLNWQKCVTKSISTSPALVYLPSPWGGEGSLMGGTAGPPDLSIFRSPQGVSDMQPDLESLFWLQETYQGPPEQTDWKGFE